MEKGQLQIAQDEAKEIKKRQVSFPAFHPLCFFLLVTKQPVSLKMNSKKAGKEKDEKGRTGKRVQEKWCDEWEDKMKTEEMKKQDRMMGEG